MEYRFHAWMMVCFGLMVFAACDRNATPTPAGQASQTAAPPPHEAPPPPPAASTEDRSLAFFPLDVNKFSMEAIQANKQRVQANPADGEALMQLGHANYMIQRFPTAKDYYEQAVRANGKLTEARLGLSNCYALLGQIDDALHALDGLLAIDRTHPEALYNQGVLLLYGKQDRDGAKRAWERLIASHAKSELSRRASAQLGRLS
jgi:tetratricopeptide (TPR) repeat protein